MDQLTGIQGAQNPCALYICTTYYHIYITLLKLLTKPSDADLVVCDDIPTGEELAHRIKQAGLFRHVWFVRQRQLPEERGQNLLDWVLFQHRRRYRVIRPMLPFQVEAYQDIYIYHDGTPLGMYLEDAGKPYHLVEDSLNFYQRLRNTPQASLLRPHNWKFKVRKLLHSGYFPLGESPYVKDIEVNENKSLQITGKPIVELPRVQMEQKIDSEQWNLILQIFGHPELPAMGSGTALLLTEPLCLDGVCSTMEEQLNIYQKMLDALQKGGFQVVIKPHPRDCGDYDAFGIQVLDKNFPIELLERCLKEPLGCVAAVSSSAVFSIPADKNILMSGQTELD